MNEKSNTIFFCCLNKFIKKIRYRKNAFCLDAVFCSNKEPFGIPKLFRFKKREMIYKKILRINQLFFQILNEIPPNYHLNKQLSLCVNQVKKEQREKRSNKKRTCSILFSNFQHFLFHFNQIPLNSVGCFSF